MFLLGLLYAVLVGALLFASSASGVLIVIVAVALFVFQLRRPPTRSRSRRSARTR